MNVFSTKTKHSCDVVEHSFKTKTKYLHRLRWYPRQPNSAHRDAL